MFLSKLYLLNRKQGSEEDCCGRNFLIFWLLFVLGNVDNFSRPVKHTSTISVSPEVKSFIVKLLVTFANVLIWILQEEVMAHSVTKNVMVALYNFYNFKV